MRWRSSYPATRCRSSHSNFCTEAALPMSRLLAAFISIGLLARADAARVEFADVTKAVGVAFTHANSATSSKYLVETMGGGVALVDYDNDGRLDIFFTNGARIDDPMPEGRRPDKTEQKFWN